MRLHTRQVYTILPFVKRTRTVLPGIQNERHCLQYRRLSTAGSLTFARNSNRCACATKRCACAGSLANATAAASNNARMRWRALSRCCFCWTDRPFFTGCSLSRTYKNLSLFPTPMFRFLKALFGKTAEPGQQTPATATVALHELEGWLRQARAPAQKQLVEQLAASRTRIDQTAMLVREKTQALQAAQLLNPNIPERAKDFMQGNREEYSRRVLQYLDTLILPSAAEGLSPFFDQHQRDTQEFTRGILRPFQILQEFFAHESKEITALLAQIEQEIVTVQTTHRQAKLDAHDGLTAEIQALTVRKQQRHGLEQERAGLEQQRIDAAQSLRGLNAEEERLLKDTSRLALLAKLNETQQRVRNHEQKIRDGFIQFEPALRKFYRMATRHVKLVERYLRDPVGTLIEDLHLDLLEVIADIQRLLQFDRLQLGEKKEYVLDALTLLTKEHLGTWMREYGQLTKAGKDAQRAVDDCDASKTLARIQRLREETRRTSQLTEQRLAQVNKDLEKIDLGELKAKLEARIKDVTGTTVTITF